MFDGKKIVVTGGTGFLGGRLVERLLSDFNPDVVRVLSRNEEKQYVNKKVFTKKSKQG